MLDYKIIITTESQIDIDLAFIWYEEQKLGLGFEFIQALEIVLNKICLNPFFAGYILQDARSASLTRFPYTVIYRFDAINKAIRVIAVMHHKRHPDWFKERLMP